MDDRRFYAFNWKGKLSEEAVTAIRERVSGYSDVHITHSPSSLRLKLITTWAEDLDKLHNDLFLIAGGRP